MKHFKVLGTAVALLLPVCMGLSQPTVSQTFSVNQVIPDGNTTGIAVSTNLTFSQSNFSQITNLTVTLSIANGYNGDYYAYLTHGDTFIVLLNRVGRGSTGAPPPGYANTGFDVQFTDYVGINPANNIHNYQDVTFSLNINGQLTGSWAPDGRDVNPLTVTAGDSSTTPLSLFDGTDPNGTWTLFLADLDVGNQGTLVNWGLEITAIPEPSAVVLLGVSGLVAAFFARRKSP
jgi:subtilisin-like proprotein convertase family protein